MPFGSVSDLMFGIGDLQINTALASVAGPSVGFLKGDVTFGVDKSIEDFMAPEPGLGPTQFLQDSTTKTMITSIKAGLAQINASNLSFAVGGDPITTTAATAQTVASGTVITLVANYNGTGFWGGALAGPAVTSFVATLNDGTTALTNNTDYFVQPNGNNPGAPGIVYINPAGSHFASITASAAIKAGYGYTPLASQTVSFGTNFNIIPVRVDFVVVRKNGRTITASIWQARVKGQWSMNFRELAYQVNDVTIEGIPDFTGHPTCPLGQMVFT